MPQHTDSAARRPFRLLPRRSARAAAFGLATLLASVGARSAPAALAAEPPMQLGVVWSRYLGGAGLDHVARAVSDGADGVWVGGITDGPATWDTGDVTPVRIGPGGGKDAFVARVDGEGRLKLLVFIGGGGDEVLGGLSRTPDGGVVAAGTSGSADFPVTPGAAQTDTLGGTDGFVARLDAAGRLLWSTRLGGNQDDTISAAAVLSGGDVVVGGVTSSPDFPTVDPVQPSLQSSPGDDGFVAVVSPDGTTLELSTRLGGSRPDRVADVAVDSHDSIVAVGSTESADFPLLHPYQATYGGEGCDAGDAFVAKISWLAHAEVFATYLGGASEDASTSVAIDAADGILCAGVTGSTDDFPWTPGAYLPSPAFLNVFVARFTSDGSALTSCARFPFAEGWGPGLPCFNPQRSYPIRVDLDAAEHRWITGGLPFSGAGVCVLSADSSQRLLCASVGGSARNISSEVAFDRDGSALLAGYTESLDLPMRLDTFNGGIGDGFVSRLSTSQEPLTATITAAPASGPAPLAVTFSATASGGTGVYTFDWDFGDGSPHRTEPVAGNTYVLGGTYTATLTVTDSYGGSASASVAITVETVCAVGCTATVPLMTSALGASALEPVPFTATATPLSTCPFTPRVLWDFGDGTTSAEAETSHAYAAPGVYDWTLTVKLGDRSCQRHGTVTVTGLSTVSSLQIVPAAAHNPGLEGTLWRTDLTAVNLGASPAGLALVYATAAGSTLRAATVPAGGTVSWPDVLASLFGVDPGATSQGTLQIASDRPVALVARTYDETAAGTLGAAYPALGPQDAIPPGGTGTLPGLKSSVGFRTNLGLVNLGGSDAGVKVTLHDVSGLVLGTPLAFTVPAGRWLPVNDVFASAGAGSRDLAYATVEPLDGAAVWAYASVVDNGTGDPTMVPLVVQDP